MANTFFGFNTTLNDHGERLGSSPEDIEGLEAEEEYDALNDETFGGLGSETELEDWEAQHEQLAEIAESSRHSNDRDWEGQDEKLADISKCSRHNEIDSLLDRLGLNDKDTVLEKEKYNFLSYECVEKNGEKLTDSKENSIINSVKILSVSESSHVSSIQVPKPGYGGGVAPRMRPLPVAPQLPRLRTVEELERMLINQSKPAHNAGPRFMYYPSHPSPPHRPPHQMPQMPVNRLPPGFQPMMYKPRMRPQGGGSSQGGHAPLPPMMMMPPSHGPLLPTPGPQPAYPPSLYYQQHQQHHPHFPYRPQIYINVPEGSGAGSGSSQQHAFPDKHRPAEARGRTPEPRDEYAGLMNNREKQWLLNIQLLQVNTGTPYFDDYYYTVFKERQTKNKENMPDSRTNQRYQNNRYGQHGRDHHHRNMGADNRQDMKQNPLNKKVYTPLQFENSLGKLQFGSVTAPRKIIDMDIITLEKDSENTNSSRDSRKTKQLLLELEALYALILKAEDLKNPVAISNTKKLKELKEKQRLREMDAAPTPEQKQEVLKLLQQESLAPVETQGDLLNKLVNGLLQDDKLISFVCIRKGKMLLLRVIPQLPFEIYGAQLLDIWTKLLLSIPLVGRRDSFGDNIFPKFYPEFKRFIQEIGLNQILEMISNLLEIIKLENNRSTPQIVQSKPPLYFIVSNKFGISALSAILTRADSLLDSATDKQQSDWSNFVSSLVDTLSLVGSAVGTPIEPISEEILNRHADKQVSITTDKKQMLHKCFIDINRI